MDKCIGNFTCENLTWTDSDGGCQGHEWIDCSSFEFSCSCVNGKLDCTENCMDLEWNICPPCDPFKAPSAYFDGECPCDIDGCVGYPCDHYNECHELGRDPFCVDFDGVSMCTTDCGWYGPEVCPKKWTCEEVPELAEEGHRYAFEHNHRYFPHGSVVCVPPD